MSTTIAILNITFTITTLTVWMSVSAIKPFRKFYDQIYDADIKVSTDKNKALKRERFQKAVTALENDPASGD